MNSKCPFYGFHRGPGWLVASYGNQCGLQRGFCPCYMDLNGQAPSWQKCTQTQDVKNRQLKETMNFTVFPEDGYDVEGCQMDGRLYPKWHKIVTGQKLP